MPGSFVEVIVVDNGSTDRTADVARSHDSPELPVRVVSCPIRGKGAATRAGVAATTADFVAFMDADGATDFAALDEGVRLVRSGSDVAVGSRALDGAVVSARHTSLRVHGAAAFRALTARIVPGIADTQCGMKVMGGDVARGLFGDLRIRGFTFDVELLARAQNHRLAIVEYPVRWVDVPGSTFKPAKHGLTAFLDLARLSWRLRLARREAALPIPGQTAAVSIPVTVGDLALES